MKNTKGILGVILGVALILGLLPASMAAADPGGQAIPFLKMKLNEPFVPATPLPESEIARVRVAQTWLLKNDLEPDPSQIRITFPRSWLQDPPAIPEGDVSIELIVPHLLLETHNGSDNPNEIAVSFPNYYFKGLPEAPIPAPAASHDVSADLSGKGNSTDQIQYNDRRWYSHTSGDSITGARGRVVPYNYYNPQGEDFTAYQEVEAWAYPWPSSGDGVEIVSSFSTAQANTRVRVAFYSNGNPDPDFSFGIYVSTGERVNYEFYSRNASGWVDVWLEDPDWGWYYRRYSDATAPTDYQYFNGSSELDTIGGLSRPISVTTYPITVEDLETSASQWHNAAYVYDRLRYAGSDPDAAYVGLTATLDSSGLFFDEWAQYFP